jgi:sulfopyruvate decarboxylase TPP-binding subunit
MSWSDTFLALLKDNDIRLIGYVPDNVLTPLIKGVGADNYFMPVNATREDEAIGTVTGAYMAGLRGAAMMQTSGFALSSRRWSCPIKFRSSWRFPRRHDGRIQIGQSLVARTMRPTLNTLGISHHTLDDETNMPFVVDSSIKQAYATQAPVAFISFAAAHRRQSRRPSQTEDLRMSRVSDDRSVTKVLNRTALTKCLVQKLRHDEAVIAGIGNANFDLFAAGHRPQNFYMLGSMGLACPIASAWRWRNPSAASSRSKATARS